MYNVNILPPVMSSRSIKFNGVHCVAVHTLLLGVYYDSQPLKKKKKKKKMRATFW